MTLCIHANLSVGQYAICSDCYISIEGIHQHEALEGAILDNLTTTIYDRTLENWEESEGLTIVEEVRKSVIVNKKNLFLFAGETQFFKPFIEKFEFNLEEQGGQICANLARILSTHFTSALNAGKLAVIANCIDVDGNVRTATFGQCRQHELESGSKISLIGSGGTVPNCHDIFTNAKNAEQMLLTQGILSGKSFSEALGGSLLFDELLDPQKHQNLGYGGGYDTAYINNDLEWTFGSNSTHLFASVINCRGYKFIRFAPFAVFQSYHDDSTTRLSTNISIQDNFGDYHYVTKYGVTTNLNYASFVRSFDPVGRRIDLDDSFSPTQGDRIILCFREFLLPDEYFQKLRAGENTFTIPQPIPTLIAGSQDHIGKMQIFGENYNSEEGSLQLGAVSFKPNLDFLAESFNVDKVYCSPNEFPAEFEEFADLIASMTHL